MRQAIILGGSRGIGFQIAKKFMQNDIDVTLVARNEVNLRAGVDALHQFATKNGLTASAQYAPSMNLADPHEVDKTTNQLLSLFVRDKKSIDILVNSAGITLNKLLIGSTNDQIQQILNTNLLGTMLFTRSIAKQMIRQKHGSIINIGSIVGSHGNVGQTVYAASKAGLVGFTKSLSKELETKNITANVISPGFIETDMTTNSLTEAQIEAIRSKIPLQRIGSPDEVANVAYFLATSPYITGQVFVVDGGLGLVF